MHVPLNEYFYIVFFSLGSVLSLCVQSEDCLHVDTRKLLGSYNAIHDGSRDTFFKVMIEIRLAFLREMGEGMERKDATKEDWRATWDGWQVRDVGRRQISLEFCAIKAMICVRKCA